MPAVPKVVKVESTNVAGGGVHLELFLTNIGTSELPSGKLIAKQTSKDDTVELLTIYNHTPLGPGETTKLEGGAFHAKSITLQNYFGSNGGTFELGVNLKRRWFSWCLGE